MADPGTVVVRVEHPVPDYETWKREAFDRDPLGRGRSGVRRHRVLRQGDGPSLVAVELQQKLEGRFNEPVSEIGRNRLQVLLEHARNALPLGGLKRSGCGVHPYLQSPAGLHGDEASLKIHVGSLQTSQRGLRRLLGHERLVAHLQEILPDHAPM